jgi:hypothetical protein
MTTSPTLHASGGPAGRPLCNRPTTTGRLIANTDRVTCGVCLRMIKRRRTSCADCGREFGQWDYGDYCNACTMYRRRNNGCARRRRKRSNHDFSPARLRRWHNQHLAGKTMTQLEDETGICQNALRYQFKINGLGLIKAKGDPLKRRRLFDRHPDAVRRPEHVTPHQESLLLVIEAAGNQPLSQAALTANSRYTSNGSASTALQRLKERGLIIGDLPLLRLTPDALKRRVRPSPQQRMDETYQTYMNARDLAWAAGVSESSAQQYLREI